MIIIFPLFLFFFIVLAVKKPTYFLIFYLLAITRFLGFFDIDYYFAFSGFKVGMPALNLVTLLSIFNLKTWYKIPAKFIPLIFLFIVYFLYGLLNPIFMNYQNIVQSLIASKEFWTFSILMYVITYSNVIDNTIVLRFIKLLGMVLTAIYIIYYLFHIGPPFYIVAKDGVGEYIEVYYPTFISLSIFCYAAKKKNITNIIPIIFLFLGIILAGSRALGIATLASLILYFIVFSNNRLYFSNLFVKIIGILVLIFVIIASSTFFQKKLMHYYVLLIEQQDPAFTSREKYNEFRWEAIHQKPLFGYGFIYKHASIMKNFGANEDNQYMSRLEVIDSGYVDLLVKFGYIGAIFYLVIWCYYIFSTIIRYKKKEPLQLTMAFYLLQYFPVNYTWSVFSFSHGLIPAFIALYFTQISNHGVSSVHTNTRIQEEVK